MGWSGPVTHRQFRTWQAWLDLEWNRPNRTDNYLMQLTDETYKNRMFKQQPPPTSPTSWVMKYVKLVVIPLTPEEKDKISMQYWMAYLGLTISQEDMVKLGGEHTGLAEERS